MQKLCLAVFLLAFACGLASAQTKGFSGIDIQEVFKQDILEKTKSAELGDLKGELLSDEVEPENYYLGPGDILLLQNLSTNEKDYLTVTPDCKVFIPRTGAIEVKDKTLAEASELIVTKVLEKNKNAEANIALYEPRSVVVEIKGDVLVPGNYTFPASFKVSTAIQFANQEKTTSSISLSQSSLISEKIEQNKIYERMFAETGSPYLSSYFRRNIGLMRSDGTTLLVDLDKARVTDKVKYNPYLSQGDIIYVPYEKEQYPTITIAGEVVRPYLTAYRKGDKASFLLKLGGGFRESANLKAVHLYLPQNDKEINLKVDSNMNILGEDYDLEPGSIITVGKEIIRTESKKGVVSIMGEVENPGVYPITSGKTKLSEAIENAGGLTDRAYLPLARIFRRDKSFFDGEKPQKKIIEQMQYSSMTVEDTLHFNIDALLKKPIVSCDFVAAFDKNDESENVALYDGDVIKIPENPKVVYVFGQVNNPGYVLFEEGRNMNFYINRAGGYAENADESRASIIRGKNKVWVEGDSDAIVYAGDEIYAPSPPYTPPQVELQTLSLITSAITATGLLINVIFNISSR